MKRVFLIVLDSFGIGEEPDADQFGDVGSNTIKTCSQSSFFDMPNMAKLGLFNIDGVDCDFTNKDIDSLNDEDKKNYSDIKEKVSSSSFDALIARMREKSMGKDTTIGHWEIAGMVSPKPMPTYPNGFPKEVIEEFEKRTGRKVIVNATYSGTKVIADYGDEHVKTGALIVYTSADSVFQIAAHEEVVPLDNLYEYCKIAREILQGEHGVGRVIARPFLGESGNYYRTPHRHDFSLIPPRDTMLNILKEAGKDVLSIGKIYDIFAGSGITDYVYTESNEDGINKTLKWMDRDFNGLSFTNLVDFDMVYGHRRDIDGYAKALSYFDERLPELLSKLSDDDCLMITADHGCDPGFTKTTDHTREYIPFICFGKNIKPVNMGTREAFADIGSTVLKLLEVNGSLDGVSMI
ncbi:MAG: phosphopentomutase [Lachnospiraceae bacterium]|nr:phosphopentomutase [Lachnospiraceae bacterium]